MSESGWEEGDEAAGGSAGGVEPGDGGEMGELFGGDVDLDTTGGELGETGNPMEDEIDPSRIEPDEGPAR